MPVETRAHALGSILHHRDAILVGNSHDLVNLIRHAIERHWHNRLRVLSCHGLTVDDRLL